jgi:arabinose-5-phosphate isomerase
MAVCRPYPNETATAARPFLTADAHRKTATSRATQAAPRAASDAAAAARRVLRLEGEGIAALARALDGPLGRALEEAVTAIAAAPGGARVIVTGMGKSGHVGRKVAATLASVGTPAYYVHPAEASHGDLGMIARGDVVLALSNSGETGELADLLDYCKRFGLRLVAVTGKATSSLAEAADIVLALPPAAEACPMGLAPTTSSTMMLALGDALAVALLERKGFTSEDFQVLHPGGRLGRKLLRVADIMHVGAAMPLAGPDTPMADVLIEMTTKRHGHCGIVDGGGRLAGIVTDGDLRRHMGPDLMAKPARAVMTRDPLTVRPEALAAEALGLMESQKKNGLFVVKGGKPVGFVHLHDALRAGVA